MKMTPQAKFERSCIVTFIPWGDNCRVVVKHNQTGIKSSWEGGSIFKYRAKISLLNKVKQEVEISKKKK